MRVLHVDCGRTMRGGQWQVLRLAQAQRAAGCQVTLMTAAPELLERSAQALPFSVLAMWKHAQQHDLLHVHDARAHSWAAALGLVPLIVSRRVAFPVGPGLLSRWKYSRPQRFIAISKEVAKGLIVAGVDPSKIHVIGDGVQTFNWRSDLSGQAIAPATDDPAKGSDLVRASGAKVQFSTDLFHDLHHASCLVYISRQEGLGSAILLAMAAGVPVVASRVGGIPEIVEHEVTGLLVDNSTAAIKAAVARLAVDEPLRERIIHNAHEMVNERFTMTKIAVQTLQVYQELIG